MITDIATTHLLNISEVPVKAKLSAPIWQGLAHTERWHTDHNIAVVKITDATDTTIVMTWRNYQSLIAHVDALEKEVTSLKGAAS